MRRVVPSTNGNSRHVRGSGPTEAGFSAASDLVRNRSRRRRAQPAPVAPHGGFRRSHLRLPQAQRLRLRRSSGCPGDAARRCRRDRGRQHQRRTCDARRAGEPADPALSELPGFGCRSGGGAAPIDAHDFRSRRRGGMGAGGGRRHARRIRQDRRRTVPRRRDAARGAGTASPNCGLERPPARRRLCPSARLRSDNRRRLRGLAVRELPVGHAGGRVTRNRRAGSHGGEHIRRSPASGDGSQRRRSGPHPLRHRAVSRREPESAACTRPCARSSRD